MKKLTLIFTLLFSTVMFSSPSFAEWTKVSEDTKGNTYYVDFERIRKHGGYVYFWELVDYLKPTKHGDWSFQTYKQGDCKMFRSKYLSRSLYTQPMGRGTPSTTVNKPEKEWYYPTPNTTLETILKSVCSR